MAKATTAPETDEIDELEGNDNGEQTPRQKRGKIKYLRLMVKATKEVEAGGDPKAVATKYGKGFRVRKTAVYANDPEQVFSNQLGRIKAWESPMGSWEIPGLDTIQANAAAAFEGKIADPIGDANVPIETRVANDEAELAELVAGLK